MKKIMYLLILLCAPLTLHANTQFTIKGSPTTIMQCEVPTGGGECVQKYYTDQGSVYITVNGVQFGSNFDAEPRSTATFVAQDLAYQISNYFGVSVTVTQLDGGDSSSSQLVAVEINGTYLLSNAYVQESNPDWISWVGPSSWWISY